MSKKSKIAIRVLFGLVALIFFIGATIRIKHRDEDGATVYAFIGVVTAIIGLLFGCMPKCKQCGKRVGVLSVRLFGNTLCQDCEEKQYYREWTKDDLIKLAYCQKDIIWMFFINLAINIAALCPLPTHFYYFAAIVTIIGLLFFISRLAAALRESASLYIIAAFIPIVGLLVLLDLIRKASKRLRVYGIKVGIFGARISDIEKIQL